MYINSTEKGSKVIAMNKTRVQVARDVQQQQRIPTRSSEREIQWRISRNNFHHSTTGHLLFPRNPRDIAAHDPGTVADRLHVDHAFPAKASRVLHVLIWIDEGGEDRRSQPEHALE